MWTHPLIKTNNRHVEFTVSFRQLAIIMEKADELYGFALSVLKRLDSQSLSIENNEPLPYSKSFKDQLQQSLALISRFVRVADIFLFLIRNKRYVILLRDTEVFASLCQPVSTILTHYESFKEIFNYVLTTVCLNSNECSDIELNNYKKEFVDVFSQYHVEYLRICRELKELTVTTSDDARNAHFNDVTNKLCMLAPHLSVLNIKDLIQFFVASRRVPDFVRICVSKLDHKAKTATIADDGLLSSLFNVNKGFLENADKRQRVELREYLVRLMTELKYNMLREEPPTPVLSTMMGKLREFGIISAENETAANRLMNSVKSYIAGPPQTKISPRAGPASFDKYERHELQVALRDSIKYLLLSRSKQLHINVFVFLSSFDEYNILSALSDLNIKSLIKYAGKIDLSSSAALCWLHLCKQSEDKKIVAEFAYLLATKENNERTDFSVKDRYAFIKEALDNHLASVPRQADHDYEIRGSMIRKLKDSLSLQLHCERELKERLQYG